MQSEQSASVLEDILQALGDKIGSDVTKETVAEELQRYLDYGVPPEQAKRTILRHHGVGGAPAAASGGTGGNAGERTKLADLRGGESFVNLLVRVVAINEKEITVKGEPKTIQYGIFGDETMTRSFTAWSRLDAEKGDVLKVTGAYTREFRGEPEIQLGDRVQVEKAAADAVPKQSPPRTVTVGDLKAGMSNVELTARILDVSPRSVNVKGTEKTVWSGILADASGKVGFTSWHDFGLEAGTVVRIRSGYVRSFRSQPQYTFDEKSTVEKVADDAVPAAEKLHEASTVQLADLYVGGGALDVRVEASLVEVRPGSGLIERCTECRRTLQDGACATHGKVNGQTDLRIKAVLDDGTGAINAFFNREITEQLLGKSFDECRQMAKAGGTPSVVEDALKQKLTARPVWARGNVLVDEFGPSLLVQDAGLVQRDLRAAAEALLAELEGTA